MAEQQEGNRFTEQDKETFLAVFNLAYKNKIAFIDDLVRAEKSILESMKRSDTPQHFGHALKLSGESLEHHTTQAGKIKDVIDFVLITNANELSHKVIQDKLESPR